jgi:hypothetical protein
MRLELPHTLEWSSAYVPQQLVRYLWALLLL